MRPLLAALLLAACSGGGAKQVKDTHRIGMQARLMPVTLEVDKPVDQKADPRVAHVRVWADAAVRALPHWKEDLNDQLDYASQVLQPLLNLRIQIDAWKDWDRPDVSEPPLQALEKADDGKDVAWVIGYTGSLATASHAMDELANTTPLGHHVVIHAWAEKPETDTLSVQMPSELGDAERAEIVTAHRRHKQTTVLLHALAITLGAVGETDPTWIGHPLYSPKQHTFSDRDREVMAIGAGERLGAGNDLAMAQKLLEFIDKTEWGGWIAADKETEIATLRHLVESAKSGKTATDIPPAAYAQFDRVKALMKQGDAKGAIAELDNMLAAYPGNGTMHETKCEIMLAKPGVADPVTRKTCARAAEVAPGDPTPHLVVGEALAANKDLAGARVELLLAEERIANLTTGQNEAWKRVLSVYVGFGLLTWTEEALGKSKLTNDPAAAQVAQLRARFGVPKGFKIKPEDEGQLVLAAKSAITAADANKRADAEKIISTAEKLWPSAPGLMAARCSLALRGSDNGGARAWCAKAIAAQPDESWALYIGGILALKDDGAGDKTGIDLLKRAIAADPELSPAWRALGKAYDRVHDKAALDKLGQDYQTKFGQTLPL